MLRLDLTVRTIGIAFGATRMLIGAFSVIYLMSKGVTLPEIGLLKTLQGFIILIIDVPLSYISDRNSRKISIILGILSGAIWLMITAFTSDLRILMIAEFFNALSLGFMSGSFVSYLIDVTLKHEPDAPISKILARYQKSSMLWISAAAVAGSFIANKSPTLTVLLAATLCLIIGVIASVILPADSYHREARKKTSIKNDLQTIKVILQEKTVPLSTLLVGILISTVVQIFIQFWQPFTPKFYDFGVSYLGLSITFAFICGAQSIAGLLVERKISSQTKAIFTSSLGILLFCFNIAQPTFATSIAFFFTFLSNSTWMLIFNAKILEAAPGHLRSTVGSGVGVLGRLSMMCAIPVAAYSINAYGVSALIALQVFAIFAVIVYTYRNRSIRVQEAQEIA